MAPSGTSRMDVPSMSSPDPWAINQPWTAVRSSAGTEGAPPWAMSVRTPLMAIPSVMARPAERKAGLR